MIEPIQAPMEDGWTDIGHDHAIRFFGWAPDRDLNPQYAGVPDCDQVGVLVRHGKPDRSPCMSGAAFDTAPEHLTRGRDTWHVESMEPLTLSPSLLCKMCGDHGFIRNGRWVVA